MQSRNWIPVLSLAVLFTLQATAPNAQEAVGKATSVRPQAEGSHAGTLSGGSNVYSKETVQTGDSGQADLQFHDKSNLSSDQNRASGSISSCTTRINLPARSRYKRHAARFDLLQDHRVDLTRLSLPMAPLAYAVEQI